MLRQDVSQSSQAFPERAHAIERANSLLPMQIAFGFFVALKLLIDARLPPIGDEAYYWLWGQRLALSYLDHPPLHAWLLRVVQMVFGWNLFSLRVLTWLTFAGTVLIFWDWAKRLAPAAPAQWFWRALLIYAASPLFLVMTSISFHDHLMIFLCFASAHFFLRFAEKWEAGEQRFAGLYIAAVLVGLAVLTKYNAVFLGLGYLAFFVLRPAFRPLFAKPQPYLASAIGVLLQAPVFYWNLTDGLASYRFHLVDRWNGPPELNIRQLIIIVIVNVLLLSPFLLGPIASLFRRRVGERFETLARLLAVCVFTLSTGCMLTLALFVEIYFYWNIVAYVVAMPLLVRPLRKAWQFWGHVIFGALVSTLFAFNFLAIPIASFFGADDWGSTSNYGWDQVSQAVGAAHDKSPQSFLVATRYTTAAQLGFALKDPDVTAIADRHDEFDYWFDPAAHKGGDAIVLADPFNPIDYVAARFRSVTPIQRIEIDRFGKPIQVFLLYKAQGFCGEPCK
jgi:hypothetical protein